MARAQTGDIYSLPEVSVGDKYEYTIPLVGVRPVKWEVVKGSLPPGIDLGQTTGNLFGWPSVTETKAYVFTVRVTDSAQKTTDYQLELVVRGGTPTILLPLKGSGRAPAAGLAARPAPASAWSKSSGKSGAARPKKSGGAVEERAGEQEGEEDGEDDEKEAAAKPTIDRPLTEDATEVRGFVPAKGAKSVTVGVYPATPEKAAALRERAATLNADGSFSLSLDKPLARGQKVRAQVELADPKADKLVSDVVVVERETRVQTRLLEGTKEIKGTADQKAGQMFVEGKIAGRWRQIGVGKVDADTGAFTIPLENALTRQDEVRVYREGGTPVELTVENTQPPDLKPSLQEGARTISGYSKARSAKVEVQVLPETGSDVNNDNALHQTQPTAVNPETGEFNVTVPHGLVAGQRVRARVENTDTWSETQTVETLGDWGRVRGYFGIGMTLSKERESFSRRDLFLNFNIDSNWYHRPHYSEVLKESEQRGLVSEFLGKFAADDARRDTPEAKAIAAERATLESSLRKLEGYTHLSDVERMATRRVLLLESLERLKDNQLLTGDRRELIDGILKRLGRGGRKRWDLHLNTFFDARLTPVPLAGQDTAAGGSSTDAFGNFVSNQKGALMQVGAYAPIFNHNLMTWNYQGSRNAVFFGPVGRVGVQTIFDKGNLADRTAFEDNDLFNFFALGARFGHYKLSGSDDRAPQLVSYLDITRGRWQNLERLVDTGEKNLAGEKIFVRRRPMRWALEGRLKIPAMPFLIGFDSNIGEGPDDLRFLFGTNFDVAQLFNLLR